MKKKVTIFFLAIFLLLITVTTSKLISTGRVIEDSEIERLGGKLTIEIVEENPPHMRYSFRKTNGEIEDLNEQEYLNLQKKSGDQPFLKKIVYYSLKKLTGKTVLEENSHPSLGEQKTIVILSTNRINQKKFYTKEIIRDIIFNQTNNFLIENSYNKSWLSGKVFGWFETPKIIGEECNPEIGIELADSKVNFRKYDRIVLIGPCDWAPFSTLGKTLVKTEDGLISASIIKLPEEFLLNYPPYGYQPRAIMAHELGHSLGISAHANAYSSCNPPFQHTGPFNCETLNYGNPFDIMGGSFNSNVSSPHFGADAKEILTWSEKSNEIILGKKFYINPLESQSEKILFTLPYNYSDSVRVNQKYSIEYRLPLGFDSIKDSSWPPITEGIYINYVYTYEIDIGGKILRFPLKYLVDLHPETPSLNDSMLKEGESYKDYLNNITISVLSTNHSYAEVIIQEGTQ